MKITKFEHSGFALEKNGETLLIDPVEFERKLPIFANVVGVVITHKHEDHLQTEVLERLAPGVKIFAPEDAGIGETVQQGAHTIVGQFELDFYGANHAEIFPGKVPCQNVGVVVDRVFAHPGDSFDLPPFPVTVLCTPIAAPWSKVADTAAYLEKAKAEAVIPIHDAVLSDLGRKYNQGCLQTVCSDRGFTFAPLGFGESIEI